MLKLTLVLLAIYHVQCILYPSDPEGVDDDDLIQYEEETAKNIRNIITAGMEKSDPIILDRVNANLATLNYTASNITVTGLAKCELKIAEMDKKGLTLKLEWACPSFRFEGQYSTKGTILIIPIEGRGDLDIRTGKYNLITNVNLAELKDKSGRPHLKIKNFILSRIKFSDPVTIRLTNLFNGDKGLAEETLKFLNDNWKDVVEVIKDPVVNAWLKIVLKHINEFLKPEPIDKILN